MWFFGKPKVHTAASIAAQRRNISATAPELAAANRLAAIASLAATLPLAAHDHIKRSPGRVPDWCTVQALADAEAALHIAHRALSSTRT